MSRLDIELQEIGCEGAAKSGIDCATLSQRRVVVNMLRPMTNRDRCETPSWSDEERALADSGPSLQNRSARNKLGC